MISSVIYDYCVYNAVFVPHISERDKYNIIVLNRTREGRRIKPLIYCIDYKCDLNLYLCALPAAGQTITVARPVQYSSLTRTHTCRVVNRGTGTVTRV